MLTCLECGAEYDFTLDRMFTEICPDCEYDLILIREAEDRISEAAAEHVRRLNAENARRALIASGQQPLFEDGV